MPVLIVKLKFHRSFLLLCLLIVSGQFIHAQGVEGKLKEETTKYEQANSEYMLIEAAKFFLLEDYERALAFLDKALEVDQKNHAAYFKKAEIYLAQNKPEEGLEAIREAINLIRDNKYYYVLGAQLEKANKNMAGAASFYGMMVEQSTDFETYLVELATTFQATNQLGEAIDIFENQSNLTLDQSMKLVEMYVQDSKENKAVRLMETLLLQHPQDMDLKYQYANLLYTVGDTKKAIDALEAEPVKTAQMRLLLSNLYAGNGQSDARYSLLLESFGDPEASLTDKTLLLGQLILESGDDLPVNLLDSLQTSLEYQYPDEALAIENGTYVYTRLAEISDGDQKALYQTKAINRYKQLKDLKPGDFKVWDQVLTYEYNSGDWETLSADAEEALSLYPNQAIFYVYLASAKIELEEPEEAEDLLSQAARMSRSNPLLTSQILGKQAEVAQMKGNISAAAGLYEQALKLEQVHPEISINYGQFVANFSPQERFVTNNRSGEVEIKNVETTPARRSADMEAAYQKANTYYQEGNLNSALLTLLTNLHTFEDNKDGAVMELYGDIYYQLKLYDIAMKYWNKAKEFGGASDKIDQKIASGKIN